MQVHEGSWQCSLQPAPVLDAQASNHYRLGPFPLWRTLGALARLRALRRAPPSLLGHAEGVLP